MAEAVLMVIGVMVVVETVPVAMKVVTVVMWW